MNNDFSENFEEFNSYSDYDKATIYDYEVYKPMMIEKAIKESRIEDIKDDISIYCWDAERVLSDEYLSFGENMVGNQIIKFLEMSIEQDDLNLLSTVWEFGVKNYLDSNKKFKPLYYKFISELIKRKSKHSALEYFAEQIPRDSFFVKLDSAYRSKSVSGAKRQEIYGNLLAAAVLYENEMAIDIFLDLQPELNNGFLEKYLNEDILENLNYSVKPNPLFMIIDKHMLKNELSSLNPIDYALERGNIHLIEKLISRGYKIDFERDDFWYTIAQFGNHHSLDYLKKNHKEEFKRSNLVDILMSGNYLLLNELIDEPFTMKRGSFNLLFHDASQYKYGMRDDAFKIKNRNIKKCLRVMITKGIVIEDITIAVLFAINTNDLPLLRLVQRLHPKDKELDLTNIVYILPKNLKMLSTLSETLNLYCDADRINFFSSVNLRTFQAMLKLMDFRILDKSGLNKIAKSILDLNLKTSVKVLYKHDFLNRQNYKEAIDYILENNLENTIQPLITCFQNEGGIKKNYDLQ